MEFIELRSSLRGPEIWHLVSQGYAVNHVKGLRASRSAQGIWVVQPMTENDQTIEIEEIELNAHPINTWVCQTCLAQGSNIDTIDHEEWCK